MQICHKKKELDSGEEPNSYIKYLDSNSFPQRYWYLIQKMIYFSFNDLELMTSLINNLDDFCVVAWMYHLAGQSFSYEEFGRAAKICLNGQELSPHLVTTTYSTTIHSTTNRTYATTIHSSTTSTSSNCAGLQKLGLSKTTIAIENGWSPEMNQTALFRLCLAFLALRLNQFTPQLQNFYMDPFKLNSDLKFLFSSENHLHTAF